VSFGPDSGSVCRIRSVIRSSLRRLRGAG
jgi:hypothetical protein